MKTAVPLSLFAAVVGAGLGLAGAPEAVAEPAVVLGSSVGGNARGYGTERPEVISMGTCASAISKITWDSWGGPEAHGTGTGCVQMGDAPQYALIASDLGPCHGQLAYRKLQIGSDGGSGSICS